MQTAYKNAYCIHAYIFSTFTHKFIHTCNPMQPHATRYNPIDTCSDLHVHICVQTHVYAYRHIYLCT